MMQDQIFPLVKLLIVNFLVKASLIVKAQQFQCHRVEINQLIMLKAHIRIYLDLEITLPFSIGTI